MIGVKYKKSGFTLIEIIISLAIVMITFTAVTSIYNAVNKNVVLEKRRQHTSMYNNTIVQSIQNKGIEYVRNIKDKKLIYIYFDNNNELLSIIDDLENKGKKLEFNINEDKELFEKLKSNKNEKNYGACIKIKENRKSENDFFESYTLNIIVWDLNLDFTQSGQSMSTFEIGR